MGKLFSEFVMKQLKIKNRVVMAPMCMYVADHDGNPNDFHLIHYGTRAVGGVGLILLEATGVESRGRISDRDLGIWRDEHIAGLKRIVETCKAQGASVGIQLAHAGRKSEVVTEPSIAPSPIAFSECYRVPVEMSKEEIDKVIKAFGTAAKRADQAGFDTIEIHGAHGYLISEFLSPLTNHRTDEYGGNVKNRARFLKEVLAEVHRNWPKEKPVILRVSAEDYAEGGNNASIMAELINEVKEEGIDLINVSSGGVVNVGVKFYAGYQVPFAETIKKETGLPVMAGGLITSPSMAEEILSNNRADMVYLGRELLRNPYWPLQAAKELREEISWPKSYERAK